MNKAHILKGAFTIMKQKSNKTNTFRIRTTEADGQDIRMKADALGCSVSEYIRRCCTSSETSTLSSEYTNAILTQERCRISNLITFSNLSQKQKNQLIKEINTYENFTI